MKAKIILIATLLISTAIFSQNAKNGKVLSKGNKGLTKNYKAKSAPEQNRTKLIDVKTENSSLSQQRKILSKGNKGLTKTNQSATQRPGDPVPGIGITKEQGKTKKKGQFNLINGQSSNNKEKVITLCKRPGRTKSSNNSSRSNKVTFGTKATDYNSSRSNKNSNY